MDRQLGLNVLYELNNLRLKSTDVLTLLEHTLLQIIMLVKLS